MVYGMPGGYLRQEPELGESFLKSRLGSDRSLVANPWQLPGEFVVARDGVIKLAYRSQYCADYANLDVLIAATIAAVPGL